MIFDRNFPHFLQKYPTFPMVDKIYPSLQLVAVVFGFFVCIKTIIFVLYIWIYFPCNVDLYYTSISMNFHLPNPFPTPFRFDLAPAWFFSRCCKVMVVEVKFAMAPPGPSFNEFVGFESSHPAIRNPKKSWKMDDWWLYSHGCSETQKKLFLDTWEFF